jgi:hypothetical protein
VADSSSVVAQSAGRVVCSPCPHDILVIIVRLVLRIGGNRRGGRQWLHSGDRAFVLIATRKRRSITYERRRRRRRR